MWRASPSERRGRRASACVHALGRKVRGACKNSCVGFQSAASLCGLGCRSTTESDAGSGFVEYGSRMTVAGVASRLSHPMARGAAPRERGQGKLQKLPPRPLALCGPPFYTSANSCARRGMLSFTVMPSARAFSDMWPCGDSLEHNAGGYVQPVVGVGAGQPPIDVARQTADVGGGGRVGLGVEQGTSQKRRGAKKARV